MATHNLNDTYVRVPDKGRANTGTSPLKDIAVANALLFVSLGALFTVPFIGALIAALLVYFSKRYRKIGLLWVRYYKQIINFEYELKTK